MTAESPGRVGWTEYELIVQLATWIDRRHDWAGSPCRPEPPNDCEVWCDACDMLRLVTDPVLREARRRNGRVPA